jgi:murein L,D-transpeptidase YafK
MRLALVAASVFVLFLTGIGFWAHSSPTPIKGAVDSLVVDKGDRTLHIYQEGEVTATYPVALSINPTGAKRFEGDGRVPEGQYHIDFHVPEKDAFAYKALYLSYPNADDRRYARRQGRSPGGAIEIHGLHWSMAWMGRMHTAFDYTLGCVAVTNGQMDQLYEQVPDGTPIRIIP